VFKHKFLKEYQLPDTTTDGERVYHSPIGVLKSVTTILGERLDKTALKEWQKAVGAEQAARESGMASRRGNIMHNLMETYLKNEDIDPTIFKSNILAKALFAQVKPFLDSNVGEIYGIEYPLWSRYLRTAGRSDLVCQWNTVLSVGDFKTAKKRLTVEDAHDRGYWYQTCAYSIMLQERTGLKAKQLVIINMPEHEEPCVLVQDRDKYLHETIRIFTGKELDHYGSKVQL
jgi:hypothetical protein